MVLLDILRRQPNLELIVAHFDHGIRKNSIDDRNFVHLYSMSHNLAFVSMRGSLGAQASEAQARAARYNFLRRICKKYNAQAIITAHHSDDVLETAIINLLRGTGRRGLTALRSQHGLLRPLLAATKQQLYEYAVANGLEWVEDQTNRNTNYLRNYVRLQLVPRFTSANRQKFQQIIVRQNQLNTAIDTGLAAYLQSVLQTQLGPGAQLPRYTLIMLPDSVGLELLQAVIKQVIGHTIERDLLKRALLFAKTAKPHKRFLLGKQWQLKSQVRVIIVEPR